MLTVGLALAAAPGAGATDATAAGAVIDDEGRVQVLVELADTSALTPLQRAADDEAAASLAALQDDVLAAVRESVADAVAVRRFETVPYLALRLPPEHLDALTALPMVERVVADVAYEPSLTGSVPLVGADRTAEADLDGQGWTVAVIDSGVDASHPSLEGKVTAEACFSQSGGCPNGETSQEGPGSAAPCDLDAQRCGHGTHVAAIAAGAEATTEAGTSPNGVAPGADILAVQVSSEVDGEVLITGTDLAAAFEWVLEQSVSVDLAAVNVSLGSGVHEAPCDDRPEAAPLLAPIAELGDEGVPTVAASGNAGAQGALALPACIDDVVSVGATVGEAGSDDGDVLSSFSNVSPALSLLAPGLDIEAAWPGSGLVPLSGTSMAAPHVAGAWATLRQADPTASVDEHLGLLRDTAVDVPFDADATLPRLDLAAAHRRLGTLTDVPGTPGWPVEVDATATDGGAVVSWTPPFWDGGEPITAYEILADDADVAVVTTGEEAREVEIDDLDNGTRYRFSVRASNAVGEGRRSEPSNVVIPKPPPPPHGFADVPPGAFYDEPLRWASTEGVVTGLAPERFAPHTRLTRAQMAALLWRMMDEPEPEQGAPFDDVAGDAYYAEAVAWLAEAGIAQGTSTGAFSPGQGVDRAQMVTFLWRLAGALPTETRHEFLDVANDGFYADAVAWAARHEITEGTEPGSFAPSEAATRAQTTALLHRLASSPRAWDPRIEPPSTIAF
ncbi:MAG: S8 family serine peptidase [Planctomycetota bacterium]